MPCLYFRTVRCVGVCLACIQHFSKHTTYTCNPTACCMLGRGTCTSLLDCGGRGCGRVEDLLPTLAGALCPPEMNLTCRRAMMAAGSEALCCEPCLATVHSPVLRVDRHHYQCVLSRACCPILCNERLQMRAVSCCLAGGLPSHGSMQARPSAVSQASLSRAYTEPISAEPA